MASSADVKLVSADKRRLKCCKTKYSSVNTCIICGNVYHNSCATRDWGEKVIFIDNSRLICKEHEGTLTSVDEAKNAEIHLLKELVAELRSKNAILEDNNALLKGTIKLQEEKLEENARLVQEKIAVNIGTPAKTSAASSSEGACAVDTAESAAVENVEILNSKIQSDNSSSNDSALVSNKDVRHDDTTNVTNKSNGDVDTAEETQIQEKGPEIPEKPWETQRQRGFRRPNKPNNKTSDQGSHIKTKSRPEPLRGSCNNPATATLKTAQRMASLFVSGLAIDVTAENIIEFLKLNGLDSGCSCEKMKTKKDKYRGSFKLSVPHIDRDKYLAPSLWPVGIIINHFLNIQSRMSVYQRENKQQV